MGIVGSLASVAGVLLAIYFYKESRVFKAVEVVPLANVSVIEIKEPVPDLRILHKNREIDELYVLTFQIGNTGTQDIRAEDLIVPFHCTTDAPTVDGKIVFRSPECDLEIDRYENGKVFFKTSLFKAGEKIIVKLTLLSRPTLNFAGNRIADLKGITMTQPTDLKWVSWVSYLGIFVAVVSLILANKQNTVHGLPWLSFRLLPNLSSQHINFAFEFVRSENTLLDQKADNGFLFDHLELDQIFDRFDGLGI